MLLEPCGTGDFYPTVLARTALFAVLSLDTHVWTVYPETALPGEICTRCSYSLGGSWYIVGEDEESAAVVLTYNTVSRIWGMCKYPISGIHACCTIGDTLYLVDGLMRVYSTTDNLVFRDEGVVGTTSGSPVDMTPVGRDILVLCGPKGGWPLPWPTTSIDSISGETTVYDLREGKHKHALALFAHHLGEGDVFMLVGRRGQSMDTACSGMMATLTPPPGEDYM
ncbi:hypothetical protein KIPB_007953 [Kipferlia bialata]|uniref:Uncharacterized protein n=1 Tax=Kipferlia bialata TaxID=797122 RepID=A0A391NSS1_9EUKA|nr:hypothetical protein KIPB_005208 [Kipferlia bialata]GCA63116.1 hypothetical protein KIPB_007953 [Kipferlia bialata]|eukprot:g5208.t1